MIETLQYVIEVLLKFCLALALAGAAVFGMWFLGAMIEGLVKWIRERVKKRG